MKTPNPDIDSFIEALRGDLPSTEDETRVRSRLLAAGVLVTSAAMTTSGVAASMGAASTSSAALSGAALGAQAAGTAGAPLVLVKAGLVSKLLVLPVAAKVGVATTLALAVAATSAPLVLSRGETPAVVAPSSHVMRSPNAGPSGNVPPSSSVPPVTQLGPPNDVSAAKEPAQVARASVPSRTEHTPSLSEGPPRARRGGSATPEPASTEPPARRVRASSLAEETRLMEQAMLAVGAGEHDLARRWLDEHARRFPEGLLARERERAVARLPQAGEQNQTSSP